MDPETDLHLRGTCESLPAAVHRRLCTALLLGLAFAGFVTVTLATVAPAADWPQWRGPDGLGVAEGPLPERWDAAGENLRWRAPTPGQGNSSPIVSGDRVFLTTAYESSHGAGGLVPVAVTVLAAAAILLIGLHLRRRPATDPPPSRWERWRRRLLIGASLLFAVVAVAIVLRSELFYPVGNPGRMWRATSTLALLGLAAAVGWLREDSRWRVAGAIVLLLFAAFIVYAAPYAKRGPTPIPKRLLFALPGWGAALWYLWRSRRPRAHPGGGAPAAGARRAAIAALLAVLSPLVFVPPNYLGGLYRAVLCFDLGSGELLWETRAFRAPAEQKWVLGTFATPTPATDGERVFAYFGSGLAALDFEGRVEWLQRFPEYPRHTRYGASASPVVSGDAVLILQESEDFQEERPSWYAAFDRRTGEEIWRVTPEEAHDSYVTPLLYRTAGTTQLLAPTFNALIAHDAASGERLWSEAYPMHQMVASMAREGDLLALTGGVYGDQALQVFRMTGSGGAARGELLWESTRSVADIASPVFYRGMLFTVATSPGIMTCYEAESGEVLWKQRLDGEYYASLLAGDGKVYAFNTEGATTVVAAAPELEQLAVNELGGAIYASPAVGGDCLLIRTADELVCVDRRGG